MALPSDIHIALQALGELGWQRQRRCSPDLLGQLRDCITRPVDRLLIAAADVDGYGKIQRDAYVNHRDHFMAGLKWLRSLQTFGGTNIVYRLGETKPPRGDWRLTPIEDEHVIDPALLLLKCFGRKLRPPNLPTQAGVLMIDAVDVVTLGQLARSEPSDLSLPVLVLDHVGRKRLTLRAPPGQTVGQLMSELKLHGHQVLSGPQRRSMIASTDTRLDRTELVLHVSHPDPRRDTQPCIRCGLCEIACPVRLQPAMILEAAQEDDPAMADRFFATSCIGCGLCTNVCPSHLPIWPTIRRMTRV